MQTEIYIVGSVVKHRTISLPRRVVLPHVDLICSTLTSKCYTIQRPNIRVCVCFLVGRQKFIFFLESKKQGTFKIFKLSGIYYENYLESFDKNKLGKCPNLSMIKSCNYNFPNIHVWISISISILVN